MLDKDASDESGEELSEEDEESELASDNDLDMLEGDDIVEDLQLSDMEEWPGRIVYTVADVCYNKEIISVRIFYYW